MHARSTASFANPVYAEPEENVFDGFSAKAGAGPGQAGSNL